MKNYYQILDVPEDASQDEIKAQRRRLARTFHDNPRFITAADKAYATKKMQEINEAYEILSEPAKKARYDLDLAQTQSSANRATTPPQRPASPLRLDVFPKKLDFGVLAPGEKRAGKFLVFNRGGPVTSRSRLQLAQSEMGSWFSISNYSDVIFEDPLEIEVTANTQGLPVGRKYDGWIEARLAGSMTRVILAIEVKAAERKEDVMRPQIIVTWDPPDALSSLFYNIPDGQKPTAKLKVESRFPRQKFRVRVKEPLVPWIEVSPVTFVPPAELTVTIKPEKLGMTPEILDLEFILDE